MDYSKDNSMTLLGVRGVTIQVGTFTGGQKCCDWGVLNGSN